MDQKELLARLTDFETRDVLVEVTARSRTSQGKILAGNEDIMLFQESEKPVCWINLSEIQDIQEVI